MGAGTTEVHPRLGVLRLGTASTDVPLGLVEPLQVDQVLRLQLVENQQAEARRLAEDLRGEGGHAEAFADLLVNGADETTQGPAGLAAESGASSAPPGAIGQRTPN